MNSNSGCFSIPEILSLICQQLRDDELLKSLASLATTSAAISATALKVLWERQDSLVPLLRTLKGYSFSSQALILPASLSRVSWSRMQAYASKMKTLSISYNDCGTAHVRIPETTARTILIRSGGGRIIPGLLRFEWEVRTTAHDSGLSSFIFLFVGPSLDALRIFVNNTPGDRAVLELLPPMCPDLTVLELYTDARSPPSSQDLQDTISRWHSLRMADIPFVNAESLSHLGRLETLRELCLDSSQRVQDSDSDRPAPNSAAFSHGLQKLTVSACDAQSPPKMLQSFSNTPINVEEVVVSCTQTSPDVDARQLIIRAISSAFSKDTLRSIVCRQQHHKPFNWMPIQSWCLLPYAQCRYLTNVNLECWMDLNDADYTHLAESWPYIENLRVDTFYWRSDEHTPSATLAALVPFAIQCHNLTNLDILIDANVAPPLSVIPTGQFSRRRVGMHFGASPIQSPRHVAAFLSALFPESGCVSYADMASGSDTSRKVKTSYAEKWKEVDEHLALFLVVRAHERERIASIKTTAVLQKEE
ncbi:hypothetical protein BD626DRAFT_474165 [Schizophyllum amplum]|uniref:F-box domain-containing protein n=1 Tax=Schizophyllum amplum TaxID=97359 RepID=A0A550CXE4_9AGAR|nr:hypothetical protein BD626DRAFT_474165 [Auriculariopsis ampla]